jgi:hypothetical protein
MARIKNGGEPIFVIPAKAGIHFDLAGKQMDPGFRRDDG